MQRPVPKGRCKNFKKFKGATLVDNRAHGHHTLAGCPAWGLALNPLVAYTSTTVYIYVAGYTSRAAPQLAGPVTSPVRNTLQFESFCTIPKFYSILVYSVIRDAPKKRFEFFKFFVKCFDHLFKVEVKISCSNICIWAQSQKLFCFIPSLIVSEMKNKQKSLISSSLWQAKLMRTLFSICLSIPSPTTHFCLL